MDVGIRLRDDRKVAVKLGVEATERDVLAVQVSDYVASRLKLTAESRP